MQWQVPIHKEFQDDAYLQIIMMHTCKPEAAHLSFDGIPSPQAFVFVKTLPGQGPIAPVLHSAVQTCHVTALTVRRPGP